VTSPGCVVALPQEPPPAPDPTPAPRQETWATLCLCSDIGEVIKFLTDNPDFATRQEAWASFQERTVR